MRIGVKKDVKGRKIKECHYLSFKVCRRWSLCFDLPMVWRKVDINGNWLTKPICNDEGEIHSNRVLDYEQITQCLRRIGHHIYHINIWQLENFASLYQMFVVFESYFNKVMSRYLTHLNFLKNF